MKTDIQKLAEAHTALTQARAHALLAMQSAKSQNEYDVAASQFVNADHALESIELQQQLLDVGHFEQRRIYGRKQNQSG